MKFVSVVTILFLRNYHSSFLTLHGEKFMAIFTTLTVIIWFSTGTLGIFATLVYVFTICVVIYDILSMAEITTLSTSILFCNLYYILLWISPRSVVKIGKFARRTWVNFTQQYGKNCQRCHTNNFTMLYGNYCYIFIENSPQKFSPCRIFRNVENCSSYKPFFITSLREKRIFFQNVDIFSKIKIFGNDYVYL